MRSAVLFTALSLVFAMAASPLTAGAWTPKKGEVYLKLSASRFESNKNFNLTGDEVDIFGGREGFETNFSEDQLALYFEWGLTDRLALFGGTVHKEIEQFTKTPFFEGTISNRDFADTEIGVRYRLLQRGSHVFSAAFLAKLPYAYDEDDDFPVGNGQEDFEARLLYGTSLGHGFYGGLEAGYRARTDDPSDEIRYLAELGFGKRRFYARTKLDGTDSVDDPDPTVAANPLLNNQFELLRWELTAGFNLSKKWHVEATWTDLVRGENIAAGDMTQVAVVLTL